HDQGGVQRRAPRARHPLDGALAEPRLRRLPVLRVPRGRGLPRPPVHGLREARRGRRRAREDRQRADAAGRREIEARGAGEDHQGHDPAAGGGRGEDEVSYQNILLEVAGGVATLTINRPDKLNALNAATLGEMEQAFEHCRTSESVRALIVTGAGEKAFVAGADIKELAQMTPLSAKDLAYRGQQVLARLEHMGKPTIAMINGFALGGGLELALACTLRTASTTAR